MQSTLYLALFSNSFILRRMMNTILSFLWILLVGKSMKQKKK